MSTVSLHEHIAFAKRLTQVMDLKFHVIGIRFGIDPLLNIIPGVGNILAAATSFYLFWIATRLKVPKRVYWRMLWNILVDYVAGVVPYIGIVFDIFYRANAKNLVLIEQYFDPTIIEGEVIETGRA